MSRISSFFTDMPKKTFRFPPKKVDLPLNPKHTWLHGVSEKRRMLPTYWILWKFTWALVKNGNFSPNLGCILRSSSFDFGPATLKHPTSSETFRNFTSLFVIRAISFNQLKQYCSAKNIVYYNRVGFWLELLAHVHKL